MSHPGLPLPWATPYSNDDGMAIYLSITMQSFHP
jgi:hypothetical protein